MSQNKLAKAQLFKDFEQWVKTHPARCADETRKTYRTDAKRILLKHDCLPGPGYRTAWNYIIKMEPQAEVQFGTCVRSRFHRKKSDCPHEVGKHGKA